MPKKLLLKHLPHPSKIKEHRYLKVFGKLIHDENLWHMNRRSISKAVAVGLFCALIPIPFQMVLAAGIAILVHANLLLSVALVWITNPFTMPPIFYSTYRLGAWILGVPPRSQVKIELSFDWLSNGFSTIWKSLLLGSFITGVVLAIIGYGLARLLWRIHVVRDWRKRQHRRRHEK